MHTPIISFIIWYFEMIKRLPPFSDILSVYAVIATMLFAWSILLFIWYLPSWLHFMGVGDLIGIFSYVMASSFIESLSVLFFLLLFSIIPPQKYFRNHFAVYGASVAFCAIGLLMLRLILFNFFTISIPYFRQVLVFAPIAVSLLSVVVPPLRHAWLWFSDRLVVFLYILIPLSVFSLFVILARNII